MPADSGTIVAGKALEARPNPGGKARLATLDDLDRRTTASRKARGLRDALVEGLGPSPKPDDLERCTTAALLSALIESEGAKALAGQDVDTAGFCTMLNTQQRLLDRLGSARADVVPADREAIAQAAFEVFAAVDGTPISSGDMGGAEASTREQNGREGPVLKSDHPTQKRDTPKLESDNPESKSESDSKGPYENGASILFDDSLGKWACYDAHGVLHALKRNRADAVAHAQGLP